MTKPKKGSAAAKRARAPKPKNRQKTSRDAYQREKVKELALTFKIQGYTYAAMLPVINEMCGPGGDEEIPGYVPVKSTHTLFEYVSQGVKEACDPMVKAEMLELMVQRHNQMLTAMMGPALQGSTQHATLALNVMEKLGRLTGLHDKDGDEGAGAGGEVSIFINGVLARV
jgi:hypothetical protein